MLTDLTWWRTLATLLLRQALQVAVPILAAIVASGGDVDLAASATALAGALAVTVFAGFWRAMSGNTDPSLIGMIVRAGAGIFAGLGITDLTGLSTVDWGAAVVAAVAAMVLAVVHLYGDPPATLDRR